MESPKPPMPAPLEQELADARADLAIERYRTRELLRLTRRMVVLSRRLVVLEEKRRQIDEGRAEAK